jgi:hypothetical protein
MAIFYLLAGGAPLEEMNEERGSLENSN